MDDKKLNDSKKIKAKLVKSQNIIRNKFQKAFKSRIGTERKLNEKYKPILTSIDNLRDGQKKQKTHDVSTENNVFPSDSDSDHDNLLERYYRLVDGNQNGNSPINNQSNDEANFSRVNDLFNDDFIGFDNHNDVDEVIPINPENIGPSPFADHLATRYSPQPIQANSHTQSPASRPKRVIRESDYDEQPGQPKWRKRNPMGKDKLSTLKTRVAAIKRIRAEANNLQKCATSSSSSSGPSAINPMPDVSQQPSTSSSLSGSNQRCEQRPKRTVTKIDSNGQRVLYEIISDFDDSSMTDDDDDNDSDSSDSVQEALDAFPGDVDDAFDADPIRREAMQQDYDSESEEEVQRPYNPQLLTKRKRENLPLRSRKMQKTTDLKELRRKVLMRYKDLKLRGQHRSTRGTHSSKRPARTGNGLPYKFLPYGNQVVYEYYDDPNELCDRLRLLISSQQAGNTNHSHEINSIIEELMECGIIKS